MCKMEDPELKAKWVAALRSGEYKQGHRTLKDGDTYCCLGVLCDVIDPDGWSESEDIAGHLYWRGETGGGWLPVNAVKLTGLTNQGQIDGDWRYHSVASMNDDGKSFASIADVIEEYL